MDSTPVDRPTFVEQVAAVVLSTTGVGARA
jgi:hypothetical protein